MVVQTMDISSTQLASGEIPAEGAKAGDTSANDSNDGGSRDRRSGSIVLSDPAPEECLGFIGSETYGWEGKIEELMGPIYALAQSLQDLDDKEHALFNEVESLYQEALKQQKAGTEMLNSHLEAIDEWMGFYKARMMELDLPRGQD